MENKEQVTELELLGFAVRVTFALPFVMIATIFGFIAHLIIGGCRNE